MLTLRLLTATILLPLASLHKPLPLTRSTTGFATMLFA